MLILSTLLKRLRWELQVRIPNPVGDFLYRREAERWMQDGLYENALDVAHYINSLMRRDRLYKRIAQELVERGDPESARAIVVKIDGICTIALVWLMIVLYTDNIEDYSALSAARLKIPTRETALQAYLTSELIRHQNSRR